jgi:hypothetical protein
MIRDAKTRGCRNGRVLFRCSIPFRLLWFDDWLLGAIQRLAEIDDDLLMSGLSGISDLSFEVYIPRSPAAAVVVPAAVGCNANRQSLLLTCCVSESLLHAIDQYSSRVPRAHSPFTVDRQHFSPRLADRR